MARKGRDGAARGMAAKAQGYGLQGVLAPEPSLPVSPKFFAGVNSTRAYVMTPKPSGVGGVLVQMETGNVDSSSTSIKGTANTWRDVAKMNLIGSAIFKSAWSATNGTWTEQSLTNAVAGITGATANVAKYPSVVTAQASPRSFTTTANGAYRDFSITTDERGEFNIAFVLTSDGGNVEISEAGTTVIETINTARPGAADIVSNRRFRWKRGTYTVRIKHVGTDATQRLTYVGPMFHWLGDKDCVLSNVYDTYAYWRDDNPYSDTPGACGVAWHDADADLYVGEFHGEGTGGEQSAEVWRFDGTAGSLQTTVFRAFKDLALEQDVIFDASGAGGGTARIRSTTRFRGDGSIARDFSCDPTLSADYFYTLLHTSAVGFSEVVFPKHYAITVDGHYEVGPTNRIVQRNPTTGQQITCIVTPTKPENTIYDGARVQFVTGQWMKPYYGPAVGKRVAFNTPFAWRSVQIFE